MNPVATSERISVMEDVKQYRHIHQPVSTDNWHLYIYRSFSGSYWSRQDYNFEMINIRFPQPVSVSLRDTCNALVHWVDIKPNYLVRFSPKCQLFLQMCVNPSHYLSEKRCLWYLTGSFLNEETRCFQRRKSCLQACHCEAFCLPSTAWLVPTRWTSPRRCRNTRIR